MVRYLILLVMTVTLMACRSPRQNTVTVSPISQRSLDQVFVELEFNGNGSGETQVVFPESWGPEENLSGLRSNLEITSLDSGEVLFLLKENGEPKINHRRGERIKISYQLTQDYQGEPSWGVHRVPGMRPVLQADYASLIGETFLPEIDVSGPWIFSFSEFGDIAKSFSQPLSGSNSSTALPFEQIQGGVFTLGSFRYSETKTKNLNLRTSIRGEWVLTDAKIASIASDVLDVAGNLFEDKPFQQYYIAINKMPPIDGGTAALGTGLNQSFFILATPNADSDTLSHLIVHELLHEWIARRMGDTDEATDPARMWFTEGFTEFFTQRILLQSGMITSEQYVENFNVLFQNYQASSERTTPNADMNTRLWDSTEMQRLPYQRGALLALHWDNVLRQDGKSLENVIAKLIDQADRRRSVSGAALLRDIDIYSALQTEIGDRFVNDYSTYIEAGTFLSFSTLKMPNCFTLTKGDLGLSKLVLSNTHKDRDCRSTL